MLNKVNLIGCEELVVEFLDQRFVGLSLQQGEKVHGVLQGFHVRVLIDLAKNRQDYLCELCKVVLEVVFKRLVCDCWRWSWLRFRDL